MSDLLVLILVAAGALRGVHMCKYSDDDDDDEDADDFDDDDDRSAQQAVMIATT